MASGYCAAHDPDLLAKTQAQKAESAKRNKRLNEIVAKARGAAEAKGWHVQRITKDAMSDSGHLAESWARDCLSH